MVFHVLLADKEAAKNVVVWNYSLKIKKSKISVLNFPHLLWQRYSKRRLFKPDRILRVEYFRNNGNSGKSLKLTLYILDEPLKYD